MAEEVSQKDKAVLETIFNPFLPLGSADDDDEEQQPSQDENVNDDNTKKAKEYERYGVKKAEDGDLDGAMEYFNMAVEVAPSRASGYNNRAQLWRLKGDIANAMNDLNKAIELDNHGSAAAQAHTQRGLIYKLRGDDEQAFQDFQIGGRLGNKFAKSMAIQCNPYAAMCNKMLTEAIGKLKEYNPD